MVVDEAIGGVAQSNVRILRIFLVCSAAAARQWIGDVAEPVRCKEPYSARQERQEQDEGRQDEQTVLSHRRRSQTTRALP